jgi:hypothetical protein
VAHKALDNFKARIRQLTRRSGGRSMEQVVQKLRPYLLGWKAYFGMAPCAPSMGAHLRVQVPLRAGHSEQSEAQLREGDRAWEGSVERKS